VNMLRARPSLRAGLRAGAYVVALAAAAAALGSSVAGPSLASLSGLGWERSR